VLFRSVSITTLANNHCHSIIAAIHPSIQYSQQESNQ